MAQDARILAIVGIMEAQAAKSMQDDGKIWQELAISQRTYYRLKQKALQELQKRQDIKRNAINDTIDRETRELAEEGLKSDLEIEMILCRIISGGCQVQEWVKGNPILRDVSPGEIIMAANTIFKKRGSNAPAKVAHTDSKGNDIVFNEEKTYEAPNETND